jgi:RimJ/RimL family protein N-acetyltransferase
MEMALRAWRHEDLNELLTVANDFEIARFMANRFPHPYTEEAGTNFINMAINSSTSKLWAIELDGALAGGIGLHPQADILCKNAEIGYWLATKFWGNGLMTAAVQETVQWGFENMDITRIFGRVFGNNLRSPKVLLKCGFIKEAEFKQTIFKNNEYLDELIYGIRLSS